jgi:16S rRNA (uracil1498-N3)-methyltransferase
MSNRFYVDHPLDLGPVLLGGPEAHHLATVSRVRPGDQVCLFNGNGCEYPATVVEIARKSVALTVTAVNAPKRELPFKIEVAAPFPKGDRGQFLVEKLTELGVTDYVPLQTSRSVLHPGANRAEKLRQYVIEASKQCGRNILMQVQAPIGWQDYHGGSHLPQAKILAHPSDQSETHGRLPDVTSRRVGNIALAVGPEGGFTSDEVACAKGAGWKVIGLGPRILRVETAALILVAYATASTNPNQSPQSHSHHREDHP